MHGWRLLHRHVINPPTLQITRSPSPLSNLLALTFLFWCGSPPCLHPVGHHEHIMGGRKRPASALGDSPSTTRVKGGAVRTGARRCGFPECGKTAKPGGFCISHGGGKKCAVQGCTTSVVSRGFCVAHGGGKRCQQPDCAKSAQTGGFCWIHGGGKKCGFEGCRKRAQSGGACISHGSDSSKCIDERFWTAR